MTLRRDRDALVVIGWREWVGLPDLGIPALKAKVDTGARTSALHAFDVEVVRNQVRFCVHPHQHDDEARVTAEAELLEQRLVRTSSGVTELRPVVRTTVEIGGHTFTAELTLTNRSLLGFRMLLGREALRRRFAVDPGKSYRCGRHLGGLGTPGTPGRVIAP